MREVDSINTPSRSSHETLRVVLAEIIACCKTIAKRLGHELDAQKFKKLFELSGPANFPEFLRIASGLRDELFLLMDALPQEKKERTLFYRRVLNDGLNDLETYISSEDYPAAMTRHLLEESGAHELHEALVEGPQVTHFRH